MFSLKFLCHPKTLMGNCCGGSATVPSVPAPMEMQAPAPQAAQRTTPAPVHSSPQLPRTRSRTASKPESTYRGMSSQDPNPRTRTKSAPQRLQSSSSQNPRTRAEMLSVPKRGRVITDSRTASNPSSRSSSQGTRPRTSPAPLAWSVALRSPRDITIQASIECVVCLPTLIPFIYMIFRNGRHSEYINHTREPILTKYFPLRILV